MEKRVWVKPEMNEVAFAADEYVAACYRINCNVPSVGVRGGLYNESNGTDGLQEDSDDLLVSGFLTTGCDKWHNGVIRDEAPEANGYWVTNQGTLWEKIYNVFWWKEDLESSSDYHATLMDQVAWETNPNAS